MNQKIDTVGCYGNTIKVASGHYIDLLDPKPRSVDIWSIAAALSKICRFGGHCPEFYSVAEHCVHAARLAVADGIPTDGVLAVLLHDAAEAYVGDMVKPLKVVIPQFKEIEDRIELAIEAHFGIRFSRWKTIIKDYDLAMLKAEKTQMWPEDKKHWVGFSEVNVADVKLRHWKHSKACRKFIAMALPLIGQVRDESPN